MSAGTLDVTGLVSSLHFVSPHCLTAVMSCIEFVCS
jgi:hypothetical protein